MTDEHGRSARTTETTEQPRRRWQAPGAADDSTAALSHGMAGYLRAVADEIGVPPEGTTFEISDTITAYVALNVRWAMRPGRDLMLVWSEHDGWSVSVETDPGEAPVVVGRMAGADPVPEPAAVAHFVTDTLSDRGTTAPPTADFTVLNRARLAERLTQYAVRLGRL